MRLIDQLIAWAERRGPDFIIGSRGDPYLKRWWLLPRNSLFNVYLHEFIRSDDDRALHDHPWANTSIILRGEYAEHQINAGGIHVRTLRRAGQWRVRWTGRIAHRVELTNGSCWTIFITGPRYREWYFHCVEKGLVHWRDFVDARDSGAIGKGCDQ